MFELTESPKHNSDCCLSLSSGLFETIKQRVQSVAHDRHYGVLLMSVGCGTGLFEATLAAYLVEQGLQNIRVRGVEVLTAQAPYLPNEWVHRVHGTWDVCGQAEKADILVFVYPRTARLVRRYLEQFHRSASLVLWLGPRADWDEQKAILHRVASFGEPTIIENAGLVQYELAVLFKNTIEHGSETEAAIKAETEIYSCEDISVI